MFRVTSRFVRGLSTNLVGLAGLVLSVSGFLLLAANEIARASGLVTNTYYGLVAYMVLPPVFVVGVGLCVLGWRRFRNASSRMTCELLSRPCDPLHPCDPTSKAPCIDSNRSLLLVVVLVLGFLLVTAGTGASMLHFMEQPKFCGTACHSVMGPEWAAYNQSPHARVRCVDCHVGDGAKATVDAKLNGMWQMVSASFDLFARPIPTPVHNLRPARETCEKCHWPDAFYGDRMKRLAHYADDEASTPQFTTLSLKIGSGKGQKRGEIHWHVAANNEVRYREGDAQRLTMRWVDVRQPDGSYHRYTNRKLPPEEAQIAGKDGEGHEVHKLEDRTLDCADCHNRATHKYEDPEAAVDRLITQGRIDRSLPFARRNALAALTGPYVMKDDAQVRIDRAFRREYELEYPEIAREKAARIAEAVAALQEVYAINVHPGMKVGWNPYPDHLGHRRGPGCFRCHSRDLVDDQGREISSECTLCHSILAWDSPEPFRFLQPAEEGDPDGRLHETFRQEYTGRLAPAPGPVAPPNPADAPAATPAP